MSRQPLIGFASPASGCLYYRAVMPARMLAERGHHVVVTDDLIVGTEGGFGFPAGRWCRADCEPDVVVLAGGWANDEAHHFIQLSRRNGQRVIVDCDDWLEPPPENIFAREGGAADRLAAMVAADAVTCSTPIIRGELARHGIGAVLARNMIYPQDFRASADANRERYERRAAGEHLELVVGMRGFLCGFHDADVHELAGKLPAGFEYLHVGADPAGATFEELTGTPAAERRAVGFFDGYPELLGGVDIAVIPFALRPFSQAKSNIAGLEWSAAGVAWLSSDHLEYRDLDPAAMVHPGNWAPRLEALRNSLTRARWARRQAAAMQTRSVGVSELVGTHANAAAGQWEAAIARALEGGRHRRHTPPRMPAAPRS